MSREKIAVTDKGAQLIPCPGCGHVVRSHPDHETRDAELNWTVTCPKCERKLCIACFPKGAAGCTLTDCEVVAAAVRHAHETAPPVLVDTPLFGGALRGDEPLPETPEPFRVPDEEEGA
jgi:uncharacterized C2H2 Zn-finger protein